VQCPNPECRKKFDQLIMLVDHTKVPRETYYACPHCKSRIDVVFDRESLRFRNKSGSIRKFRNKSGSMRRENRSSCPHYFGYLKLFTRGAQIPEECLTCKRLTECMAKES